MRLERWQDTSKVRGDGMTILQTTTVIFDPSKEYKSALEFEENHQDWVKSESTVAVGYTKTTRIVAEVEE